MATPTKLPSSGRMQKDTPAKNDSVSSRLSTLALAGGGKVPTAASPSGGRKIDDVKARLSPGEFVIPKAAVAARGPGYWASQELAARGKPVTSKSVASAVYAPQRGGTQHFWEGGESGDSGDSVGGDASGGYGFGVGASGFGPSPGVSGNASQGWGGVTGGMGTGGYGSVGGNSSTGFGSNGMSVGPASGSGGGSVGWGGASAPGGSVGGVGNTGGFGGGGSSGGGGASSGYGGGGGGGSVGYGGVGGASAGSAGGTGPGRGGGIYGASQIGVPSIPGILANTGASGAVVTAPTNAYATMNPALVASLKAELASLYGGVPSGWGQRGVSVPASLTGSPIGVASSIGVTPGMFGGANPSGQRGGQVASGDAFGGGTPANFGQPSTGVNALARYGIGPTMGVGMGLQGPGSAFGVAPSVASSPSVASIFGPSPNAPSMYASNMRASTPSSVFGFTAPGASASAPAPSAGSAAARGTGAGGYSDPRIAQLLPQIFRGGANPSGGRGGM